MDITRDEARETPVAPAPASAPVPAAPPNQLPYAVATWLQRVDAAAHPKPKLAPVEIDPKQTNYKLIYVLAPPAAGAMLRSACTRRA